MEGQRGRPVWRPRSYGPIESRHCYECGKLGHLSYDCPNLQVQGKLANVTKDNQVSYDGPENVSPNESDSEEFSEREYEKDEYEVQAFMARGQGERQERAEAREARRRREEEEANPAQPSAPVRPSIERVVPQRQVKRKPVLEAQWQKYVRENWTIPIGMLAGEGDRLPDAMSAIGGSGPARVRGHVKSFYSAGEKLKAPVSIEP